MRKTFPAALAGLALIGRIATAAEPAVGPAPPASPPLISAEEHRGGFFTDVGSDLKAYYTAPLHWGTSEWAWFGGSLAAIAAAHHFDTQVRTHFVKTGGPTIGADSKAGPDIAPTVAVLAGTWLYASYLDDRAGYREGWTMLEAAGLGSVTAYALKYAAGRETPYQTSDPNQWREGGSSFPSLHATAAFAVGTVLAESGSDDYRWIRRFLGYGLGAVTSYERLKHNTHWLSDTVAGAALGIASARFALNRNSGQSRANQFAIVPVEGGAMLTYQFTLD